MGRMMIQVRGLTRYYGSLCAVRDVTFQVNRGEVFGLERSSVS